MSDVIAAERYTRALFELAQNEGDLAGTESRLLSLAKALETQPKILLLIENPTLTTDQKYALVLKVVSGGPTGLLERFLRVLIEKKRFALLPEIQKLFHARFEEVQSIREVEVASAVPFSAAFREKLQGVLKKKFRSEIRLIPRTDRDLLGGFVLRFAGKEIDCSFRNRLHEIQQKLFSSFQEGIA